MKKSDSDANFNEITIYKSNNWESGSRIMFAQYGNIVSMRIFNKNGVYICGYNFSSDIYDISKLFKKAVKFDEML